MGITLEATGLDKLEAAFNKLPSLVEAGVKVGEPGVAYALAWEYGKISINPGPKTLWSTNALGDRVVLTKQAPHGYIRINKDRFTQIINSEISKIKLSTTKMDDWGKAIEGGADKAAQECTDIIRDAAPVDSGDLRNSIEPAFVNDPALSSDDSSTYDLGSFGMNGQ